MGGRRARNFGVHTLHKRLITRDHFVTSPSHPCSSQTKMANTQPQVCVFSLCLRLEAQLYVQCHVTYFAEQFSDASVRQSTASGMFVCVHHNPLLDWKTQITRHVDVLRSTLPRAAVCNLRCVTLSALEGQEYSSYVQWSCALQYPVPMGNVQPYVCATLFIPVHQWTAILNYTLNIMRFPEPRRNRWYTASGVWIYSSFNRQEQPNNISCLCAFQSPVMSSPTQPQVCVYLTSPLMDGGSR